MTTNEDFWNSSYSSAAHFFDDVDDSSILQTEFLSSSVQEFFLPLHCIISNKCLSIIIDDNESNIESNIPFNNDAIKHTFLTGRHLGFNSFRSLQIKLQLLDAAIEISDGNLLVNVILFLLKTLNKNIFFTELSKRKIAVGHYVNYLVEKNNFEDLADLYIATGNIHYLKNIYYVLSKEKSKLLLQKKLGQFNSLYTEHLYNYEDKQEILDHLKFLDFQIKNNFNTMSTVELLITLLSKDSDDNTLQEFKKLFKIDELQFEWILMSVLCRQKKWDNILSVFLKSAIFLNKRTLKTVLRPELLILGIGSYKPPEKIMQQILNCVNDSSRLLHLAEKLQLHMVIVNYYMEQKDKNALLSYMEKNESDNSVVSVIQSALNNQNIKWKN